MRLGPIELPSHALHAGVRLAFGRFPGLREVALRALQPVYRVALFPFRRAQGQGVPSEQDELLRNTAAYNDAAERYYANCSDPTFLLNKPFSEPSLFAKHLIDVGNLVAGARLEPGDTVMEFGAGTCWLSHFLNRFGCTTISVDVSPSALNLGRRVFNSDPTTNWGLHPQFLHYDGRVIPLGDESCDRIVINDAFHHLPNQRELLFEMYRVLRPDGIVAMSEPGRGHASAPISVAESAQTGVLENELVLEDVATLAERVGFSAVTVLAASPSLRYEVPAKDLGKFMGGRGFARYWKALCSGMDRHHYLLMYKGCAEPTTVRPGELNPRICVVSPEGKVSISADDRVAVTVNLANLGDTVWLGRGLGEAAAGWTRLGAHLYRSGSPRALVDYDWCRAELGQNVGPGESVAVTVELPAIRRPGNYVVELDLVIEGALWFADRGTRTAELPVTVR